MLCGWVCLPCSLHTKQSCQAVNVSKMQINTKQWKKWILMGIMAGSCATDVQLVFEKQSPRQMLTCSLPALQLWVEEKENANHNLGTYTGLACIPIKQHNIYFCLFLHWRWHCCFNVSIGRQPRAAETRLVLWNYPPNGPYKPGPSCGFLCI